MTVEKAAFTEMTAFGIAGLSAVSADFWTDDMFRGFKKTEKIYNPQISDNSRNALYAKWREAVLKSLKWSQV